MRSLTSLRTALKDSQDSAVLSWCACFLHWFLLAGSSRMLVHCIQDAGGRVPFTSWRGAWRLIHAIIREFNTSSCSSEESKAYIRFKGSDLKSFIFSESSKVFHFGYTYVWGEILKHAHYWIVAYTASWLLIESHSKRTAWEMLLGLFVTVLEVSVREMYCVRLNDWSMLLYFPTIGSRSSNRCDH